MQKDVKINLSQQKNLSKVWPVKIRDGHRTLFSWNKTLRASSVMSYWQVSSCLTLVPFQPVLDLNYGETTGFLTLRTRPFQWLKELIHWKSYQLRQSRPDGKMKGFHQIPCHSRTLQSFHHAQDGHCWSTHNYKDQTGSEAHKETTYHQLTSTKNTGWENWQRTFQKVVLYCSKVSNKKSKPHLTHYCLVLLWRKQVVTHCNWAVR